MASSSATIRSAAAPPGDVVLTIPAVTLVAPIVGFGPVARLTKTLRIGVETHAFHAQDVFDVTSNFRAVAGVRYDHISLQRGTLLTNTTTPATAFSPFKKGYRTYTGRVGGVWILTKEINASASFSRAAEPVTQLVGLTATNIDFSLQKAANTRPASF